MEFRIEIVGAAVVLLAAAAGLYYYYYYVRRRNDMDMIQANAGAVSRASQASARASVAGGGSQAGATSQAGIFSPPAGSQLAVTAEDAETLDETVPPPDATVQDSTLQDETIGSNRPLSSSPVGSAVPKSIGEQATQETEAGTAMETTVGSGRERLGSLRMHYEGSQSSPGSGGAMSTLGTTFDIDEEGTLMFDCCTIVAICMIAGIVFSVGICYLYGFTFQQLRQHPRFIHGLAFGIFFSLLVILGYMYRLGHIPIFAVDSSMQSVRSGATHPASTQRPTVSGSPNATTMSGGGSMTLRTKTALSDVNQYPIRSSEVVKRVCPPDPCPFGGGGGARESKVKAMSAAKGEEPTSQQITSKAEDLEQGGAAPGEAGAGGVGSGAAGVPSGKGAAPGDEGAGAQPPPADSGAMQGEPIVVSPEETVQETEGIEGGDQGISPPFDVHAAAVVPCGTWIDDIENREWAVQERMKKVVDIVDETTDMYLTPEELACLNRIRAIEGKGPIVLGPGLVTQIQDALEPLFREATPVEKVEEEEPGKGYVSEVQDILAPHLESASAKEQMEAEEWPWWCLYLLPLLLLLAFIAWMCWTLGIWGFLVWLKDMLLAVLAFLCTPAGIIALIACLILLLVILYYLCTSPEDEGEAAPIAPTSAQPLSTPPTSAQPIASGTRPTTAQPGTEEPGLFENACQYVGDTVGQLAEMGYGKRPKEYFKITYEEDLSEEMWQKYKQRQQSFYVTGGSAIPAGVPMASASLPPAEDTANAPKENVSKASAQQQIMGDVGSSPVSEAGSGKSTL